MTVAVSASKVRIYHDLSNAVSGRDVNEDTDTLGIPVCKIGHVCGDIIWQILYLHAMVVRGTVSTPLPCLSHILLGKIDTKSAFRQVAVELKMSPTFTSNRPISSFWVDQLALIVGRECSSSRIRPQQHDFHECSCHTRRRAMHE